MKEKPGLLPRTIDASGKLVTSNSGWWTSGCLWNLYEYTNDEMFRDYAIEMTKRIEKEKENKGTHDLGFMSLQATGSGLLAMRARCSSDRSQITFNTFPADIGCIQSWEQERMAVPRDY